MKKTTINVEFHPFRLIRLPEGIKNAVRRHPIVFTVVALAFAFYLGCIHYIDTYEVAITWNRVTGRTGLDTRAGFHLTAPWVAAARIDTRPTRVCITSSARSFNCRLVQFVPSAYRAFLAMQGFHYYWLANRLSFNGGYDQEYRGMHDILRGYTYSTVHQPFVQVVTEYPDL